MDIKPPTIPESCSQCPYIDQFHSSCSHPLRQDIINAMESGQEICPAYPAIRAEAMQQLEMEIPVQHEGKIHD